MKFSEGNAAGITSTPGNQYQPATGWDPSAKAGLWLVMFEGMIVKYSNDEFLWPSLEAIDVSFEGSPLVTGIYQQQSVAIVELASDFKNMETITPRSLLMTADRSVFALVSHGLQVHNSYNNHGFCGRCGHAMCAKAGEWAQVCPDCNYHSYPIISPCIIVVITRGDEVLLVQHHRHQKQSGMHTLVAGFIEPGESAEQAVLREVLEETGLVVTTPRYCFSQSWPFPHSLMLGFQVEYKSGALKLDEAELCGGGWFKKNNLPEIPPPFTISRQLIDQCL